MEAASTECEDDGLRDVVLAAAKPRETTGRTRFFLQLGRAVFPTIYVTETLD